MLRFTTLSSSSKGNCHILECDSSSIMIDCGIHFSNIIKNTDITKLEGVFITHRHNDHSKGAKDLSIYTNCNYYMNEETYESIELYGDRYKKKIEDYGKIIETKDFKVLCFDVYHDVQNTNFLILHKETNIKILYITDTSNVSNLHFKDIDLFVVEGNFSKSWDLSSDKYKRTNSEYGHLPIEDTIEFLLQNINSKTKKILIGHISYSFDKIKDFEDMVIKSICNDDIEVKALNNHTLEKQVLEIEYGGKK